MLKCIKLYRENVMSCILYKLVDGKPVKEMVEAVDVAHLLDNGYSSTPDKPVKRRKPTKAPKKESDL